MECFSGDVNRMECGGVGEVDRIVLSVGVIWDKWGGVRSGLRRLCVVCATTESCCKCNIFIQNHAPVSHD